MTSKLICKMCGSTDIDDKIKDVCKQCAKDERELRAFYERKVLYNGQLVVTG